MSSNLPDETNFFYNPYLLPPENDSPDTAIPFYTDHDIDLQPYTSSPNNEFPFKAENRTETDSRDSENETFINIPQTPYTTTSMTWMPQPSPYGSLPVVTSKIDQSKKIKKTELEEKRTKAKQRELEKKGFDLQGIPEKFIPEGFETADPKTREKMIRMMKNRLSAQQSREKKKQKYQNTEQELQHYKDETERLQRELTEAQKLIEEMKKFIKSNMGIDYPTQKYDLSRSSSMKGFMKTGFLVLGLICVICLSVVNPGSTEPQGSIHTFPNPNNGPNSATTGPIYPSSSDKSKTKGNDMNSESLTGKNDENPLSSKSRPDDNSNSNPKVEPMKSDDPSDRNHSPEKMPAPYSNNDTKESKNQGPEFMITKDLNNIRNTPRDQLNSQICDEIRWAFGGEDGKHFLFKLQCLSQEGCWNVFNLNLYNLCQFR